MIIWLTQEKTNTSREENSSKVIKYDALWDIEWSTVWWRNQKLINILIADYVPYDDSLYLLLKKKYFLTQPLGKERRKKGL